MTVKNTHCASTGAAITATRHLIPSVSGSMRLLKLGLVSPPVIPTLDGSLYAKVGHELLEDTRQVDLLAWVDGTQIGSSEEGLSSDSSKIERDYRTIGREAARIHNQASRWSLPSGFTRHAWDEEGLVGNAPVWGQFWELQALTSDQKATLLKAKARIYDELKSLNKTGVYSLIHADLVPENVLSGETGVQIIDFDDSGFGWHMFEIATALYFIQGSEGYDLAKTALIAGYREERPLSEEQLAQLPMFLAARSFTYLGWLHTRPSSPELVEFTPALIEMSLSAVEAYFQSTT